eukprot:scaffold17607_cov77-Cylindrotheca_fusiformis.AAC.1
MSLLNNNSSNDSSTAMIRSIQQHTRAVCPAIDYPASQLHRTCTCHLKMSLLNNNNDSSMVIRSILLENLLLHSSL